MNPLQTAHQLLQEAIERALRGGDVKPAYTSKHRSAFKRSPNAKAQLNAKRKAQRQARNKQIIKAKQTRQRRNSHVRKML